MTSFRLALVISASMFVICLLAEPAIAGGFEMSLQYRIDPVTRYVHISYQVLSSAPDEIVVQCEINTKDRNWLPASVWPYMSDTARVLSLQNEWEDGILRGRIVEKKAAGLTRTVVWNPFSETRGKASVNFRLTILDGDTKLASMESRIDLDNSDVVMLDDWSKVIQKDFVSENPESGSNVWWFRRGQEDEKGPIEGESLEVMEKNVELPQLTYPLNLKGYYAVFVTLPPKLGSIELRLSGDERPQVFYGQQTRWEEFWRWSDMTRQHLVIKQPYSTVYEYEDEYRAHLDMVRLVPLTAEMVRQLGDEWKADGERLTVIGYNEPYSWAFYENIESTLQHREPLLAFAEARVEYIDIQMGRGGCHMVNETRIGSQLIADTMGDPVRGKTPRTNNVGRMQQYTNMLATQLKYAREFGMKPIANLGATNCYVGTPLESDFSREHPEWVSGSFLKYEVPEVKEYVLALLEEALQIGAERLSVDWCRYPYSVTNKEIVNDFFREVRSLADKYGDERGIHVEIATRFPARGVGGWENMDYATWAKEGLVDFLCPSNIQGRHLTFDISEYLAAAEGTDAKVLPCADALDWGLPKPGMWLNRILDCYEAGSDGIYIYQCDGAVLPSPEIRRYVSIVCSVDALRRWRDREKARQPFYSKGIYISPHNQGGKYSSWERLRVWVEGIKPDTVRMWVDGKLMNTYNKPPYVLTSEEHSDDSAISSGKHLLRIRAESGADWLEKEFEVEYH